MFDWDISEDNNEICNCEFCNKEIKSFDAETMEIPSGWYFSMVCSDCKKEISDIVDLKIKEIKERK